MSAAVSPRDAVPLELPYYGASFATAFVRFWRKYAVFSGRASRSEYWWWVLFSAIVGIAIEALYVPSLLLRPRGGGFHLDAGIVVAAIVASIWGLATIVPTLALVWRRLHDANFSGAFWLFAFVPLVGWIVVLVLTLLPPNPAGVRFDRREPAVTPPR
ncbi:DUF805 domain-containing protein [Leifsonia sp. NPDC080035]|uniref:DUF805 domain-containing protein n=1 Tax=Leifsonia sp. NPDC080035 TaxID=3143936 RepID=A0AAU7G8K2_9MICO